MQNIKWKTESELTPALVQLNQNLLIYQANPSLLKLPQNQKQYYFIQQNQIMIQSQINQYQMTYKQLEVNLKYTQDMYQKNKDEQYIVPIDETIQPMISPQNTFNLTQRVTDIIVTDGGWQKNNIIQLDSLDNQIINQNQNQNINQNQEEIINQDNQIENQNENVNVNQNQNRNQNETGGWILQY